MGLSFFAAGAWGDRDSSKGFLRNFVFPLALPATTVYEAQLSEKAGAPLNVWA